MGEKIQNASYEGKSSFKLPKGAKIVKKDYSIRVEEIENGFIVSKNYDIKYILGDESNYEYFTKKWYSEDNPLSIDTDEDMEISLADKLDL